VVAHEVRNPLAVIKNAVSSLRRPLLPQADRATLLAIVSEEASRLSRLVRDLLAFARPRAPAESNIELRGLLDRAVRDATKGDAALLARIDVELLGECTIQGDPELLRLAIANVVENALQSGDSDTRVSITVRDQRDASGIELTVADQGRGMAPEVRKKARDPFFTTRPTGTGLGLAIADRVIKSHAGQLEIESARGEGCSVRMRLPARPSRVLASGATLEAST
jgi:signal transduction histidine kinase